MVLQRANVKGRQFCLDQEGKVCVDLKGTLLFHYWRRLAAVENDEYDVRRGHPVLS